MVKYRIFGSVCDRFSTLVRTVIHTNAVLPAAAVAALRLQRWLCRESQLSSAEPLKGTDHIETRFVQKVGDIETNQ